MRTCIFKNLKAEMARYNITRNDIAKLWGVSEVTVTSKLQKGDITIDEANALRNAISNDLSLDYLFEVVSVNDCD